MTSRYAPIVGSVAALGSVASHAVRACVEAARKREENLTRCRVLAQAVGQRLEAVEELARSLEWDMAAVTAALSPPPSTSADVVVAAFSDERLRDAALKRPDVFTLNPDGSFALRAGVRSVEFRRLPADARLYSVPVAVPQRFLVQPDAIVKRLVRKLWARAP